MLGNVSFYLIGPPSVVTTAAATAATAAVEKKKKKQQQPGSVNNNAPDGGNVPFHNQHGWNPYDDKQTRDELII